MEISFKPSFIRDFMNLPLEIKQETKRVCVEVFPSLKDIRGFNEYELKPIKGFHGYYRIKLRDYRIGLKEENGGVIFMRVKHRKDIYKVFP